jgi:hypothetical protein
MPEHRPETGGLLLPPVPYVWPFGIRFGPNDRQTGSCTLAANFVGIRRAFALSAFEYSAMGLGPRFVGGFLEIRRLSSDRELTKPRSRVVLVSARWISKYSIRFNAFPPKKRCFARKSFLPTLSRFLRVGIFIGWKKREANRIQLFLFACLTRTFVRCTLGRYGAGRSRHGEFIQPARRAVLLNSLKSPATWWHVVRIFVFSRRFPHPKIPLTRKGPDRTRLSKCGLRCQSKLHYQTLADRNSAGRIQTMIYGTRKIFPVYGSFTADSGAKALTSM